MMDATSTIRLVARLSTRCWTQVDQIFDLYEQEELKGQKKAKGELGLPDCKKSNWQFLHRLPEKDQFALLCKIKDKSLSFTEASAKANAIKTEEKVYAQITLLYYHNNYC